MDSVYHKTYVAEQFLSVKTNRTRHSLRRSFCVASARNDSLMAHTKSKPTKRWPHQKGELMEKPKHLSKKATEGVNETTFPLRIRTGIKAGIQVVGKPVVSTPVVVIKPGDIILPPDIIGCQTSW